MELLRRVGHLASLPTGSLEQLASGARIRGFRRDDVLLHPGLPAESVIAIGRGFARTGAVTPDGRRIGSGMVGPGAMIGVLGVLDPTPTGEEVRGLGDGLAVEVSTRVFRDECERSPPVALAFGRLAAEEARRARDGLVESISVDVPTRVARHLVDVAAAMGVRVDPKGAVVLPLLHRELADLAGTARETVTKALSTFAAAGWVVTSSRRIVVLDERSLSHFARLDGPDGPKEQGFTPAW